jgi:hypothetical protein
MKRTIAAGGASVLAAVGFAFGTTIASADPPGGFVPGSTIGPGDHVPICHALGNGGYVAIAPSAGVVFGHAGSSHQGGRDIIPPFIYRSNQGDSNVSLIAGQGWASGQSTWSNGCVAVVTTTTVEETTTAATTTTVPTTTTSVESTTTAVGSTTIGVTTTEAATTTVATRTDAATTTTTAPFLPPVVRRATKTTTTATTAGAVRAKTRSQPVVKPTRPSSSTEAPAGGLAYTP